MTAHKHAESMRQYYTDAMETEEPWKRWEMSDDAVRWTPCDYHPDWDTSMQYRHRPRTIMINGFEVPEPLRQEPAYGDLLWLASLTSEYPVSIPWEDRYKEMAAYWMKLGLLHVTQSAAHTHVQALLSFTKQE